MTSLRGIAGTGRILVLAALVAACTGRARADTTYSVDTDPASGISIRLTTPLTVLPHFGFMPVRMFVENNSNRDGEWRFRFQAGSRTNLPGELSSGTVVTVAAGHSSESWFFVPLAEPGILLTSMMAAPVSPASSGPPSIPGVLPGPSGVNTSVSSSNSVTPLGTTEKTWIIHQTGPSGSLPNIPASALPPRTTMSLTTPNLAGQVTRTTLHVVDLTAGSFGPRGGGGKGSGGGGFQSQAEAVLAGSGLLNPIPGVTQTFLPITNVYSPGGGSPVWVVVFGQTGNAADLPRPPPGSLPAGVIVNLHQAGIPGQILRTISYVEPGALAAFYAWSGGASRPAQVMNFQTNAVRLELARYGFGLNQPGVRMNMSARSYTGGPGAGPTSIVSVETGPAALLPAPLPGSLPPNYTSNISPGALPGEAVRNIVIPSSAVAAPPLPASGQVIVAQALDISASVSGPGVLSPGHVSLSGPLSIGGNGTMPIAVSTGLEASVRALFATAGVPGAPNLTPVDPVSLPADWRLWSSFHGVALRASEYAALDVGRRSALQGWVGLGGQLLLEPDAIGPLRIATYGAGTITTFASLVGDMPPDRVSDQFQFDALAPGLPNREKLALKDTALGDEIMDTGRGGTSLVVFILGFAIVSGPLNLLWFAGKSNRHRLFWTTPLLAVVGSVALAVTILLQDGLGGSGRRSSLVVLLPGLNQAAVFQEEASRTGFLSNRAFAIDADAVLASMDVDGADILGGSGVSLERNESRASGDWFRNRSRQAHEIRRLAPTRGRIERVGTGAGGAPIVESSLQTVLRGFLFSDASGRLWASADVTPGRPTTLSPAPAGASKLNSRPLGGSKALASIADIVAQPLPGHWFGWGDETAKDLAPVETLASVHWQKGPVAFAGVAETTGGAPAPGGVR